MFDVSLTFDNGPDASVTPAVLNALARRNIRSTFFVVGEKLADPQLHSLAARAHEEGHWIGNHTFSHSVPLGRQSGDVAEREIGRTEALIGALAHPDKLFRPYGGGGALDRGLLNASVVTYLTEGHYLRPVESHSRRLEGCRWVGRCGDRRLSCDTVEPGGAA